jgi:hypothetical protein
MYNAAAAAEKQQSNCQSTSLIIMQGHSKAHPKGIPSPQLFLASLPCHTMPCIHTITTTGRGIKSKRYRTGVDKKNWISSAALDAVVVVKSQNNDGAERKEENANASHVSVHGRESEERRYK